MIEFKKQVGWVPSSYLKKCPKLNEEEDVLGLVGSCEFFFTCTHGTSDSVTITFYVKTGEFP